jgi:hypothetical protein
MEKERPLKDLMKRGLISLLIVVIGCGASVPPSTQALPASIEPPPRLRTDSVKFNCDDVGAGPGQILHSQNGIFIDHQLLLRGPEGVIRPIAAQYQFSLLRFCRLTYISDDMVLALYAVPENLDPLKISIEINETNQDKRVSADPNYLVSSSGGSCADPYSGGGSPSGSLKRIPNRTEGRNMFFAQWGPKKIGVPKIKTWTDWSDVHVAVFDTMPPPLVPAKVGIAIPDNQIAKRIQWRAGNTNSSIFHLKVYDFLGAETVDPGLPESPVPANLSSHGFFVAGLIRLIAPNSQIHLIRVLGDNACGHLEKLEEALDGFMALMEENEVTKVVINLSLGVRHLPGTDPATFKLMLKSIYDRGVVIVGAAGNYSPNLPAPKIAQEPARSGFVIGVVAIDTAGKRSCYSNRAAAISDVAAPGGNGGQDPSGTSGCVSRTLTWNVPPQPLLPCTTMDVCDYGVISLIEPTIDPIVPSKWRPRYGFWSGTSFSTPLVSALAALVFEKKPTATKEWVYCAIPKGARPLPGSPDPHRYLGAGVINVNRTLALASCP